MPKNLTDLSLRAVPGPAQGTVTHWDNSVKGFGVRVSPKGTKTFIALVGSGARHKIGRYPLISLADARGEARRQLAKKTLGSYEKPSILTYNQAVERYVEACTLKNRPSTVSEYRRYLALFPFGDRRLTSIRKRDVADFLDAIKAHSERAHALVAIKVFFSWCAGHGAIEASPLTALKTATQRTMEARHALSPAELSEALRKAHSAPKPYGHIVALLILTGQRRNEIASLRWDDVTDTSITIRGEIAKNHRKHSFPIGQLVRDVLASIPRTDSPSLFPASRELVNGKPTSHFNGWSKAKRTFDATLDNVAPYKLHDLRRTFATTLQQLGVPIEVREKLLNHVSGTQAGIAGVYNVYAYEREMTEAVAKFDDFMISLLAQGKPEPLQWLPFGSSWQ